MTLSEYAALDPRGLADAIARRQLSPKEAALAAARAIDAINPRLNAVVETYADRIDELDERTLGNGPFRGVPFLIKDVFGQQAGRRIEWGSRLCRGMVAQQNTYLYDLLRASGVNILGRSATPEYSMSGTTESAMFGNTSTPWKHGYSAGGSTGGGMAAVIAGIVPIAHGTDIAGSIRIPASFCGGVGLKPSRGRISYGPAVDENGYGLGQNFVQTKSVRDAATMLDCLAIPQPGDPFFIPTPAAPYATLIERRPPRPRIRWATTPVMGVPHAHRAPPAAPSHRLVAHAVDGRRRRSRSGRRGAEHCPPARGHGTRRDRDLAGVRRPGDDARDDRRVVLRVRCAAGSLLGAQRPSDRTGHARAGGLQHLRARAADEAGAVPRGDERAQRRSPSARPVLHDVRGVAVADNAPRRRALWHLQPRSNRRDDGEPGGCDLPGNLSVLAAAQRDGHAGDLAAARHAFERPADRHPDRRRSRAGSRCPAVGGCARRGAAVERARAAAARRARCQWLRADG